MSPSHKRKNKCYKTAIYEPSENLLFWDCVRRIPCFHLPGKPAWKDSFLMTECIERELAMIRTHSALSNTSKWQVRVGKLQSIIIIRIIQKIVFIDMEILQGSPCLCIFAEKIQSLESRLSQAKYINLCKLLTGVRDRTIICSHTGQAQFQFKRNKYFFMVESKARI